MLVYFVRSFVAVVLQRETNEISRSHIFSHLLSLDNVELVVMHSSKELLPPLINTVKNLFMKTPN